MDLSWATILSRLNPGRVQIAAAIDVDGGIELPLGGHGIDHSARAPAGSRRPLGEADVRSAWLAEVLPDGIEIPCRVAHDPQIALVVLARVDGLPSLSGRGDGHDRPGGGRGRAGHDVGGAQSGNEDDNTQGLENSGGPGPLGHGEPLSSGGGGVGSALRASQRAIPCVMRPCGKDSVIRDAGSWRVAKGNDFAYPNCSMIPGEAQGEAGRWRVAAGPPFRPSLLTRAPPPHRGPLWSGDQREQTRDRWEQTASRIPSRAHKRGG